MFKLVFIARICLDANAVTVKEKWLNFLCDSLNEKELRHMLDVSILFRTGLTKI